MRSNYLELKDKLVRGTWIFTCSMKPLQFSHVNPINLDGYDPIWKTKSKEEQDNFINDSFETIEGSHHSFYHCSCRIITEEYAKWFLDNKIYNHFSEGQWDVYESKVKELAKKDGIEYEGI